MDTGSHRPNDLIEIPEQVLPGQSPIERLAHKARDRQRLIDSGCGEDVI